MFNFLKGAGLILFCLAISAVSTIPFSIGLLAIVFVFYKKQSIFFLAFIFGLFLDLISIRILGYSSLILVIFTLLLFLYEKKFETQTSIFIFASSFLGGLVYLKIFDFQSVFLSALINSVFAVIVFKLLWLKLAPPSQTI